MLKTSFIDFVCVCFCKSNFGVISIFLRKNVYHFINSLAICRNVPGWWNLKIHRDGSQNSPRGCYQVSVFLRYKHQSFGKGCNMAIGKGTSLGRGVGFCWVVSCWVVGRSGFIGWIFDSMLKRSQISVRVKIVYRYPTSKTTHDNEHEILQTGHTAQVYIMNGWF